VGSAGSESLPANDNDNTTYQPGGNRYADPYRDSHGDSLRDAYTYLDDYTDHHIDANDHADRHVDVDACSYSGAHGWPYEYTRADHCAGTDSLSSHRKAG
jgi:hypothetical protein